MDIGIWMDHGIMDCNLHRVFIWLLFDHDSRVYSFVTFLAGIVGLEELQFGPWKEIGVQSCIYDLELSVSYGWELQSKFPVLRVPVWWGFLFELLNWRGCVTCCSGWSREIGVCCWKVAFWTWGFKLLVQGSSRFVFWPFQFAVGSSKRPRINQFAGTLGAWDHSESK